VCCSKAHTVAIAQDGTIKWPGCGRQTTDCFFNTIDFFPHSISDGAGGSGFIAMTSKLFEAKD
jgi:hypothetical protein